MPLSLYLILHTEGVRRRRKKRAPIRVLFFGAGDRTRTGTLSPAVDFESTTSTNSITPAGGLCYYTAVI